MKNGQRNTVTFSVLQWLVSIADDDIIFVKNIWEKKPVVSGTSTLTGQSILVHNICNH